ncbi:hypothetical protein BH24ACT22_BH24ACT22_15680 [soil metagenome]
MDLSTYKWKHRLFLIFAQSPAETQYKEQLHLLEGTEADFWHRDLLLGKFLLENSEFDGTRVSAEEATRLRNQLGVAWEKFTVLLVGKDDGEKFRSGDPASADQIFRRIDAMPMRRREMHERG